jgi:uncharacterized membrane protein
MFYSLFLKTTDPSTPYSRLLSVDVVASIVFHATVYTFIVYCLTLMFSFFKLNIKLMKMFLVFVVIMCVGYVGRLARVKQIRDRIQSKQTAMDIVRKRYFVWYFLG